MNDLDFDDVIVDTYNKLGMTSLLGYNLKTNNFVDNLLTI